MIKTWLAFLRFDSCGRKALFPFLSALLLGATGVQPAMAGCFYFSNVSEQVFHVSVRAEDIPVVCPATTCWAADIPPGATQEYCPGPVVLPLPPPPGLNGPENHLYIMVNGMGAAAVYLSGLRRNFTCNIAIRKPPNWSQSYQADGCQAAGIPNR